MRIHLSSGQKQEVKLKNGEARRDRCWFKTCSLAAMVLLAYACSDKLEAFRNVQIGDKAPVLLVEDLNGREISPALTGKITILLFWQSGDARSLDVLAELAQLAKEFKGQMVDIVAIADAQSKTPELSKLVKRHSLTFPVFIDRNNRNQEKYGVGVFPSAAIVSADGRLQFYHADGSNSFTETIRGKLKDLLGTMPEREHTTLPIRSDASIAGNDKQAQDHYKNGLNLWHLGKREQAARELTQAIARSPTLKEARLQLGYLLLELGDAKGALREFQYVKNLNPQSPSASMGISISYIRLGELEAGIELLERAVSLNPNPVRGYAELGRAYETTGDLEKALFNYKRAISKLLQGRR